MKFFGPLLYIAVTTAVIAIPVYAASKLRADTPKVMEQVEIPYSERPAPEVAVPGSNWRPTWVVPTREYHWKPPPVQQRIADRPDTQQEKQSRKPSKKNDYARRREMSPPPNAAMSYAAEERGGAYEPGLIGKD